MNSRSMKLLVASILMSTSLVGIAQTNNIFTQRSDIIQKNAHKKPLVVGFYNLENKGLELNNITERFLPFSNYLSEKLDSLVVFDVDNSFYNLNKQILENSSLIYTSSLVYSEMKEAGWNPLVKLNSETTPSLLVKATNKIKEVKDLKGKKVVATNGENINEYALYELITNKVYENKEASVGKYTVQNIKPDFLVKNLDNNSVQAVLVNSATANKILAENKDKYRVVPMTSIVPGAIVYVNNKLAPEETQKIKNVFLDIKNDNLEFKMSGQSVSEKVNQFVDVKEDELKNSAAIFKLVKDKNIILK